jgi:serine protease Do
MIRTLFDDDGAFVPDGAGAATPAPAASLVADDKYSLQKAIKLPAGARYRLDLRGQAAVRERPGWGQFRFLRFAFRKSGAGRACLELEHREAANRPARYDAGVGEPSYGAAKRVRDQALPGEWVEFTRDLFADFGPLDIDGVSLSAPDGDYVLFDQIYLAKTIDDFRHLPKRLPPELTNADAKKTAEKAALERALPACVSVAFGDGRVGTGMLISPDGDVLTAGHLAIGPIRTARIHLADGRSLEGQTRGVCRDLDLGIVRISTPGPYPWAEIENFTQLAADDWYFAVARKGKIEPGAAPITAAANVRRVVGSNVWTDFDPADWSAGGVLLNRYGRLVAVHTHRSRFGGAIHSLLASARPTIDRMRNGEFWGRWSAETTPASGLTLRTTGQGCQATAVAPGSSAAGQGLQPADLITRVDGRPVLMSDDVWQAQAEKDPGATVDLEYRRGTQTSTARIYLAPRLP